MSVITRELLNPQEASDAITTAQSMDSAEWRHAGVSGRDGSGVVDPTVRSVQQLSLGAPFHRLRDRILQGVAEVNSETFEFDLWGTAEGDDTSILRYQSDAQDHYRPHRDYGPSTPTRKLTFVVQLSTPDSYIGGDLVFPDENTRAPRDRGTLIVFPTFLRHTVTPVVAGTRYAVVGWVHGPTFK
ncbi:prolyl hydroxylase family protein [Candidatus Microthrix parvicella]|uniref:prolyl hydroxylase family protein n=1 Tax=Candidatus Neomicrothrix parvicella TaxID=41950 RepID=UPI000360A451|nr:2OG-Fe(II) oxygenase [Candidatus Microthrix parvicella]